MKTIGVCIVTYNEEKYIAQAIESVLSQECDANVVAYVGNDCSTDATGAICRDYENRYPGKVICIDNEYNLGLVGNTKSVLDRIKADGCEYVAMLDGDDYWCDMKKLQKQLTFLEEHDDYGFVHTNQKLLYFDARFKEEPRTDVKEGDIFEWAGQPETAVANCTAFFRTALLQYTDLDDFIAYGFKSVDYAMYIVFMKYTKFHFMHDFTAVWRRGHVSVSGGGDIEKQMAYLENGIQQWKYLGRLFPDRWPYSEENGDKFRKKNTLKLAYKYNDFSRAHSVVKSMSFKPSNLYEGLLRFCAGNKLLFALMFKFHYSKALAK